MVGQQLGDEERAHLSLVGVLPSEECVDGHGGQPEPLWRGGLLKGLYAAFPRLSASPLANAIKSSAMPSAAAGYSSSKASKRSRSG